MKRKLRIKGDFGVRQQRRPAFGRSDEQLLQFFIARSRTISNADAITLGVAHHR